MTKATIAPRCSGAGAATLLVAALAACGTATPHTTTSHGSAAPRPAHSTSGPQTPNAAVPPAPGDPLTAFGARVAAWNAHHAADPRFNPGSAYNPNPSLGDHTRFDDQYYGVITDNDRIMNYSEQLTSGTTITQARVAARSELPRDAREVWFKVKDSCAQAMLRSTTLAKYAPRVTATGTVLVEFSSGDAADHYDGRSISTLILSSLPDTGPDGVGC